LDGAFPEDNYTDGGLVEEHTDRGSGEEDVLTGAQEQLAASHVEAAPVAPPAGVNQEWAICCSGVGARAATYCLGVLQGLDDAGLTRRAKWLVGIAGGSYIVASYALVRHALECQARSNPTAVVQVSAGTKAPGDPGEDDHAEGTPPAFAHDTAEEQYLRDSSRRLVLGASTMLVGVLTTLLGAASIFVLAGAPVYAFSHAWGWLLAWQGVLTWAGGKASASITAWTWWLIPVAAAACTGVLFVYWRMTLASRGPGQELRRARWISWASAVTAGLSLVMLAEPLLISWLYNSTGVVGSIVHFFGFGGSSVRQFAVLAGLVMAVTAVTWFGQRQLVKLGFRSGLDGGPFDFLQEISKRITDAIPGWPGAVVGALLYLIVLAYFFAAQLAAFFAASLIIIMGAFAALMWSAAGARAGFTLTQLWPVIGAFAIVLLARIAADVNRLSRHDLMRWQLADTYAVTRRAAVETNPAHRQRLLADAALIRLSELSGQQKGAEPVICATARINPGRDVRTGSRAFRLTLDPAWVTLHGVPSEGHQAASANTPDYEHLVGHTHFTLFDLTTISDSPSAPEGSSTFALPGTLIRGVYQILLTATSMRRGFWMPHPSVVRHARGYLDEPDNPCGKDRWWWLALIWYMLPRPHADRRQGPPPHQEAQREARLWAHVLKLREAGARRGSSRRRRFFAALLWRTMQPTLGLLWAAAAGRGSYRATWMYATDAQTSDNLGLVEALRRGAANILVLDAGPDSANTWFSLGAAIATAKAYEGVDIALDPTMMVQAGGRGSLTLGPGQVVRPWATGTFTRDPAWASATAQPAVGRIWICKLGWWQGAPWDIRAYASGHPGYPDRNPGERLYDGAEFDAYRKLGLAAIIDIFQSGPGFIDP
jgi:hypothetical protein